MTDLNGLTSSPAPKAPDSSAQPTPTQWNFNLAVKPDGSKFVVVDIATVVGLQRFFLNPAEARNVADLMVQCAAAAEEPQILTPVRHLMGPDGNPIYIEQPVPPPPGPGEPIGPPEERLL